MHLRYDTRRALYRRWRFVRPRAKCISQNTLGVWWNNWWGSTRLDPWAQIYKALARNPRRDLTTSSTRRTGPRFVRTFPAMNAKVRLPVIRDRVAEMSPR